MEPRSAETPGAKDLRTTRVFSILVEPDMTSVTIPPEFMEPGMDYKVEVLAREESGNKTITEVEFETEGGEGDDDDDDD